MESTLFTDLTVNEQASVSGGTQTFSGSSSSISGQATTGRVSGGEGASSNAFQNTYNYPTGYSYTTTGTSASGSSNGYTYPT